VAAIVCLGTAVRDLVFAVPSLPSTPQKITASTLLKRSGGMAATAAVAAAALGGTVEYWGRLGDDETGRELRLELESRGVQVRACVVHGTQTPTAAVLVADNGERMLAVFPGRLDDSADWLPLEKLSSVQAVHADFRWPQGARALYAAALERRIPRVLDADGGDPAAVRLLLALVDHAIFSQTGLAELTGNADIEAGLRKAASLTAGVVGVTLGEQGSVFLVDGVAHRVPAPKVVARDTNGAGDVFHGAYTLALAQGADVIDASRFATIAAALKCRNGSGWEAAPDRAAVNEFLKGWVW
jgi:sulfofructose kinase